MLPYSTHTVDETEFRQETKQMFSAEIDQRTPAGIAAGVGRLGAISGPIVGGTLLVEIVFSYPGLGFLLFRAVGAKDYPLMQGIFLVITISVLVANLIADIAYLMLDPRTRKEG